MSDENKLFVFDNMVAKTLNRACVYVEKIIPDKELLNVESPYQLVINRDSKKKAYDKLVNQISKPKLIEEFDATQISVAIDTLHKYLGRNPYNRVAVGLAHHKEYDQSMLFISVDNAAVLIMPLMPSDSSPHVFDYWAMEKEASSEDAG